MSQKLFVVRVTAREAVVPRGTEKQTWWLFDGERWLSVRDHAGSNLTQLETGPSVVWETAAEVTVAAGTWFMKLSTRPATLSVRDPLHYLQRGTLRTREHWTRTYFIVNEQGRLQRPTAQQEAPQDDPTWLSEPS